MHDSIAKSRFFAYNKCGEGVEEGWGGGGDLNPGYLHWEN